MFKIPGSPCHILSQIWDHPPPLLCDIIYGRPLKLHVYFLKFNIPTRLNWILIEQTHSPIRLSLWHLENGTLFLRPPSQQLIIFNLSRQSTDTFDFLNLLFSRYKSPPQTTEVVSFWRNFFLYQYHYKKKKKKKKKKCSILEAVDLLFQTRNL